MELDAYYKLISSESRARKYLLGKCFKNHQKVDHQKYFSSGRVYINGLEGFWSWAKERLMKHHGVSKGRFPLYLKEL